MTDAVLLMRQSMEQVVAERQGGAGPSASPSAWGPGPLVPPGPGWAAEVQRRRAKGGRWGGTRVAVVDDDGEGGSVQETR